MLPDAGGAQEGSDSCRRTTASAHDRAVEVITRGLRCSPTCRDRTPALASLAAISRAGTAAPSRSQSCAITKRRITAPSRCLPSPGYPITCLRRTRWEHGADLFRRGTAVLRKRGTRHWGRPIEEVTVAAERADVRRRQAIVVPRERRTPVGETDNAACPPTTTAVSRKAKPFRPRRETRDASPRRAAIV